MMIFKKVNASVDYICIVETRDSHKKGAVTSIVNHCSPNKILFESHEIGLSFDINDVHIE